MTTNLQPGQGVNLLFGYQPVWDPTSSSLPFFAPSTAPVNTSSPNLVPVQYPYWTGTPTITLHESAADLLSAVYNYKVAKMSLDPADVDVPPGPLALGDADSSAAMASAGQYLGLDLTKTQSYMLVTMTRINQTASHDFLANPSGVDRAEHLTSAAQQVVNALTPASPQGSSVLYDSKLTKTDVTAYIAAAYQIGTHFVSELSLGDQLIQVFAYDEPDKFKILKTAFDNDATLQPDGSLAVVGQVANSYVYYTKPTGPYGYVSSYGSLAIVSRDPALQTAIAAGSWKNANSPSINASIFAGASDNRLLTPLAREVVIGFTLTPVADLITNLYVAGPFDHLIKGGLLQKYGNGVKVPIARAVNYNWGDIFVQASSSWASPIVTPNIDVYQERVDLAKVNLMGMDVLVQAGFNLKSFTSFSQVLEATVNPDSATIMLPSDSITLIAQIIDMTQATTTPAISMGPNAFQNFNVYCQEMYGSLVFETTNSGRVQRKTALDGFLYETKSTVDPTTHRYVIDIISVLSDKPPASLLSQVKQSIEFSVVAGESLLQAQGTNAQVIRELEQSYLIWLANMIPEDTTDLDLANNRARALYLAHNVSTFGADLVYVPYISYEGYNKFVGDMVTLAQTLNGNIFDFQGQITSTINTFKVMNSIANLNDNVKAIGGVLTQYFGVLAQGRKSMNGYYDSIASELERELTETLTNITALEQKLGSQQASISGLGGIIPKFEQDYADYSRDLIAQCVVSAVEGLFSAGLSMAAIPGAAEKGVLDALKAIKDVYDKLQTLMKVLSALKAVEGAVNSIDKINALARQISDAANQGTLQMPTQVALQAMSYNVQAALVNVPDKGNLNQDKANLIAAVKTLVAVGTALVEAQTRASQIIMEIANNNRLKTINQDQETRLAGLVNNLHLRDSTIPPDLNSIDLIGLTGQLQYQLKQVLLNLARVLELQNGAIQYEYFGTPATLTSFSLLNLLTVISTQDNNIINAIQQLNPPPQKVNGPITVTVRQVPVSRLSGTDVYQFPIHLADPAFLTYDMVRIDRVVPKISGVRSTDSGKYEIHLSCQGKPFQDRNYSRTPLTFATSLRKFGPYVFEVGTNKEDFGSNTGTFADKVTPLTPFSMWQISLPSSSSNNQNIQFESLFVDISFDFYITAHYDSSHLVQVSRMDGAAGESRRRLEPMDDREPMEDMEDRAFMERLERMDDRERMELMEDREFMEWMERRAERGRRSRSGARGDNGDGFRADYADADQANSSITETAPSPPSLSYLEGQMYQNEAVLQDWDAVFNVLEGPVNAFLFQQFQAYIQKINPGSQDSTMKVVAYYCEGVEQFRGQWFTNVTQMSFTLSNPLLEFVAGNDSVTVIQDILEGSINTGTLSVTENGFTPENCHLVAGDVNFTTSANTLTLSVDGVFEDNIQVKLTTTGTLPAPLAVGTDYWIVNWQSTGGHTTLQLSDSAMGAPITITGTGSGVQTIAPDVFWGTPVTVDTSQHPYVQGSVALSKISGIVTPPSGQGPSSETHTVILDFPQGAFVLNQFAVNPPNWDPAHHSTSISNALANYYANHEVKYQIQTINYTNLSQDVALQPTAFALNAVNTNAGNNVLQMLIATTGQVQHAHTIALFEPVAYDPANPMPGVSDFMTSLMVSSELMFQHIFVNSFNQGGTNIQVAAVKPGVDFKSWSARVTQGTVVGNASFDNPYVIDSTQTNFRMGPSGNNITWDLTGLNFLRTENDGLALSYSNGDATTSPPTGGTPVPFQYQQWYPGNQYAPGSWGPWTDTTAIAYITMTGSYPLEVVGSGISQEVQFTNLNPTVSFTKATDLKPASGCHCNDNAIKIALLTALAQSVPGTLETYLKKITFKPISVLALESLLFPAAQLTTLGAARVPGDLLVVGSFLAKVLETSPSYNVTISAASGAKGVFNSTAFQNGVGTSSARVTGLTKNISFTYGPIKSADGPTVDYTLDLETGVLNHPMILVVYQPNSTTDPAEVILLPPGYGPNA